MGRRERTVTADQLTAILATRVMGWKVGPDRFIKAGRAWLPKWRFNPFDRLDDAFLLLDRTGGFYALTVDPAGIFTAEVRIGDRTGKAAGDPKPRTTTLAVVRALDLEAPQRSGTRTSGAKSDKP